MSGARIKVPRVYAGINAITAELSATGIAKTQVNQEERYKFRGIDDVLGRLAPLLATHRLCILPRVLERTSNERWTEDRTPLFNVSLKVAFDIVSARDGSVHTIVAFGEALDAGDKATAKAMSAAFKHIVVQAFCIPVGEMEDPDARTYRLTSSREQSDPVQGWDQWSLDVQDLIRVCVTPDALDRVQAAYRDTLRAASKRRPDLYAAIGKTIAERRESLASPASPDKQANDTAAKSVAAHV